MKKWYSAQDLISVAGLPSSIQGIHYKAKSDGWVYQNREKQGGGKEYHLDSLPMEVKQALILAAGKIQIDNQYFDIPKGKPTANYNRDLLWAYWKNAGKLAQEKAAKTLRSVKIVEQLVLSGVPRMQAYKSVAEEHGVSLSSIRRACTKIKGVEEADWAAVLLPKQKEAALRAKNKRFAFISPDAWEFFKTDYLRPEEPSYAVCYQRLADAAEKNGWVIPSCDSVRRRVKFEIPEEQRVLLRKGRHALMSMYPAQERTVLDLHAMEWINGDGYQHNVFVEWFNGEVLRPKTWFWQDIYSRKIIGWRCDISENTDSIRLSLMDVFEKYGIPKELTIDNTRAAANKWMTGGVPNRYRFKVKEDDPLGIIPMFGIKLHWTSVIFGQGHGQAKPVERAFGVGGLEEYIDKHPSNQGAYTGPNPMAKPDNYGSTAIKADVFLQSIAKGVEMFNAKQNRRTEVCHGTLSFNDAFNESYQNAPIVKALPEQLQMMMLQAEAVRVTKEGSITLNAGGSLQGRKNRYAHEAMYAHINKKLVARFDPQALHQSVEIFTLQGVWVCTAQCIEKVAFGDTQAAREHKRKRTQHGKATKIAADAQLSMNALELAEMMKPTEEEFIPETKVVEPLRSFPIGNTVALIREEEEIDESMEINFAEAVERLAAQKRKNQL